MMINLINNKTLYALQRELGPRDGLAVFETRCVGNTTGAALEIIGQLMKSKQEVVDLKFADPMVKQYIIQRLDQMGLVGFIWDGDNLSYYPFKEHENVKETVREVKIQVSPFDGEAVAPRSYRVKQYPTGAEALQYSVEQGNKSLREALDES
ncbi:hypothetical phage protein [Citrobacter phage CR8]|uniref:Hypothetical phage protein n=1 Tax=Citrobacter phage CR8 TaxID=1455076 RepID=W6PPL9_9CAUD|nr:hypothetical protein CF79_gp26 [Citrobacter phage CR8]CDM21610.1 hypothetical phage protein [Citrobacter phage CR8]